MRLVPAVVTMGASVARVGMSALFRFQTKCQGERRGDRTHWVPEGQGATGPGPNFASADGFLGLAACEAQPESPERGYRARPETASPSFVEPLASADPLSHTEPCGSVFNQPTRCLLRGALGRHPTWRSGKARTCRRFDLGSGPNVPHDPHGHEEARRR